MHIFQHTFTLPAKMRGYHIITGVVIQSCPEISTIRTGMLQVFMQHTSAGLTINENADPTVRKDFDTYFNKIVPENDPDYRHRTEGPDDMPAHLKAAMIGGSVLIPVTDGQLALGDWQGIYLCEFRDRARPRTLVCSLWGI